MIRTKNILLITFTLLTLVLLPSVSARAEEKYTFELISGHKYISQDTNVRKEPSLSGEKVGMLKAGSEFYTTGRCKETGWYRVIYNDDFYYMSDKYVMDFLVKSNIDEIKVVTPVDIRQWPDDESEIVGHMDIGTKTLAGGITDDGLYYKVNRGNDIKGFIPASAVEIIQKTPRTTEAVEGEDDDAALFSKEPVSSTKVMLIAMPIAFLAAIFIAGLAKGNSVDSKSSPDLPVSSEKDTSIFGIDWDGDGKVSMTDDFITMDMMDDDFL